MQWPVCSKSDSRKIPARITFVLFVFTAALLPAQIEHETSLSVTPEYLSVSMTVAGADVESLFATLHDGMRVRMEYRIRIAAPRRRPFRMLGDQLLREFRPSVEVRWDPFEKAYVVESDDGNSQSYAEDASLYSDLFALTDYRIPWSAIRRDSGLVVETSAEYTPIVFVPGLSILSLFAAGRSESTAWERREIPAAPGAR